MASSEPVLETTEAKDPSRPKVRPLALPESSPAPTLPPTVMLEIPSDLAAAIKKAIAPVPQINERALEERILVKARLATMRMLVQAKVVDASVLNAYEQSNAAVLNPDNNNIASAAFGALSRPPQQEQSQ